jgi:hypothetical protein
VVSRASAKRGAMAGEWESNRHRRRRFHLGGWRPKGGWEKGSEGVPRGAARAARRGEARRQWARAGARAGGIRNRVSHKIEQQQCVRI